MKKDKPEIIDESFDAPIPVALPEPSDAELIARRNAALAEYGIKDERIINEDE